MVRRMALTASAVVALFLVAPILLVIPMSFSSATYLHFPPPGWSLRWYGSFFHGGWLGPTERSFEVAAVVTVCATVLGTLAALALSRRNLRGAGLVAAVLALPMIVPVIIYAIGAYAIFIRWSLIGNLRGLMVAHVALALPFVVINVGAPLRTLDPNVERAARSLGASPLHTFRTVTLPQILPGVIAGALFAFLTSFDEVVIALFVTSPATQTLPVRMFTELRLSLDPTIAAAATLLIGLSTVVLGSAAVVLRRGETRSQT
jgi:putative spermidine/putrescine transport system permease protein